MSNENPFRSAALPDDIFVSFKLTKQIAEDLRDGKEVGPKTLQGLGFSVLSIIDTFEQYVTDVAAERKMKSAEEAAKPFSDKKFVCTDHMCDYPGCIQRQKERRDYLTEHTDCSDSLCLHPKCVAKTEDLNPARDDD